VLRDDPRRPLAEVATRKFGAGQLVRQPRPLRVHRAGPADVVQRRRQQQLVIGARLLGLPPGL
jgi:hypothetical protein